MGAALAVFLASAVSDRITGKPLSAVWNPWATRRSTLRISTGRLFSHFGALCLPIAVSTGEAT